jgi:hypothetical protein
MSKWVKTAIDLALLAAWGLLVTWLCEIPFTMEWYGLSVAVCALLAANDKEDRA